MSAGAARRRWPCMSCGQTAAAVRGTRCLPCWQQELRDTEVQRFWAKVEKGPGCWLWTGNKASNGYGTVSRGARIRSTHRVAFEIAVGAIPDGLHVLHHCDVKLCVRPDHLFVGTNADNMADMAAKGRASRANGKPGEAHPTARLRLVEVEAIRASSGIPYRDLAARYGVRANTICKIRAGRRWGVA